MTKRRVRLTDLLVSRLRPPAAGRCEVWDALLPAFGLRLSAHGGRSWVLLTRIHGRLVRLTLGKAGVIGVAEARELAREALRAVARGEDPRVQKRIRQLGGDTVEAVAAGFVEQWCKRRNRSWKEQERLLRRYVLPAWQGRTLDSITRADVIALVDRVAAATPIQGNRVLAVCKRLFSWALDRGIIEHHPAARLAPPAREHGRDRVLADEELVRLWRAWERFGYPFGRALQLLLLTGCRRGEVAGMHWEELDLPAACWTVPSARTKQRAPHVVPLSSLALEVLRQCPRGTGPFVLSSRAGWKPLSGWSKVVAAAAADSGVQNWRIHDLRRTLRTNLSRFGVSPDIAERVLGHAMPGVRGVYDRFSYLDEKRAALERWAQHVRGLVGDAAP